jgi:hypothetical protein
MIANVSSVGRIAAVAEDAFAAAWSIGEMGLAIARPHELVRDPHHAALHDDVRARGFHVPLEGPLDLARTWATIRGTNPYRRIDGSAPDRVLAHFHPSRLGRARHLVVVCHCYGIPSPWVMRRLFGLDGIHADVVTNVMGNHQPGTYLLWPGSGLVSARTSRFVENVRSAVTGVRALVRWLRREGGYDTVSAIGFSIGGQLALHLAHAGEVDRALLYCPVTSVATTARELGLMRVFSPYIDPAIERLHGVRAEATLGLADPLALDLPIPEEQLHVVAHRHDRMTPLHQLEPIRAKYPKVGWTELPGTHLLPLGLRELHGVTRRALAL